MSKVGLILARYTIEWNETATSFKEQKSIIKRLNEAPPIPYRVKDPTPNDNNTYIIQPRYGKKDEFEYITFIVCRDINQRQVRRVDRDSQTLNYAFEDTEDCQIARIVAIPSIGALAAEDATGDGSLGGWSAIKRVQALVGALDEKLELQAILAGTAQDLHRAVSTWELDRFTFQARPFNPHPSNPGLILSALMEKDGVGELRGMALPKEGAHINPKDEGIVKEAIGLADKGYAVYGAEGRTPSGAEAKLKKQPFSFDRDQNLKRLSGPQNLRVYIEADDDEKRVDKMVDVMIEFFKPKDK